MMKTSMMKKVKEIRRRKKPRLTLTSWRSPQDNNYFVVSFQKPMNFLKTSQKTLMMLSNMLLTMWSADYWTSQARTLASPKSWSAWEFKSWTTWSIQLSRMVRSSLLGISLSSCLQKILSTTVMASTNRCTSQSQTTSTWDLQWGSKSKRNSRKLIKLLNIILLWSFSTTKNGTSIQSSMAFSRRRKSTRMMLFKQRTKLGTRRRDNTIQPSTIWCM